MYKKFSQHYYLWLLIVIIITGLCGLIYTTQQQILRQGANDPQIEVSGNFISSLNSGASAQTLIPKSQVDPSQSLSPFVIIYDQNQTVVGSSVTLDGKTPNLPSGVLSDVAKYNQEKLTWQPKPGVRIAAVITKYNQGFVLIGRSLKEVEAREDFLAKQVLFVWLGLSLTTTIFTFAYPKLIK